MTLRPFNRYAQLTALYDELEKVAANRYSADSQARIFVLYDELVAFRKVLAVQPDSIVVAARIAGLRDRLRASYSQGCFPPYVDMPVRLVGTAPLVLEFDRETFDRRYATAAESIRSDIVAVDSPDLGPLKSGVPYMFVVDDAGTLLVWNHAFTLDDLIFGRNRAMVAGTPVAHPMLVPDRLRVMTAGEVIFIGAPKPSSVIANTKSGHFRPPPVTEGVLRETLRTSLGVQDRDLDLFTLGSQRDA